MSELLAIGVSHKTAPVEVRERLVLTDARAAEFLRDLHGVSEIQEVVALSTCNRTELYLVVDDPVEAESTVLGMLAKQASIQPKAIVFVDVVVMIPPVKRENKSHPRGVQGRLYSIF